MIQVQNVTFFQEKNMILISRGQKKVWVRFTDGGDIVVKIKGFDRYWFNPDTGLVYSEKTSKIIEALKPYDNETKVYFWLHKNGFRTKVYLWEILRDNMQGIELFFKQRLEDNIHLRLA